MSIIVNGKLVRNNKWTGIKTVVKGLRAEQSFFDKVEMVAKAENISKNELIVRVVSEYCEKVENTMIKQMEKCLNGEMLMSGIVRPIRAKEKLNVKNQR